MAGNERVMAPSSPIHSTTEHPVISAPVAPLVLSIPEACQALRVGRSTLNRLMQAGKIHPIRIGDRVLFPLTELNRYVTSLMETAA